MMIVTGLVSGFTMNEIADKFIKGCKPMIYASFITGLASAIAVILRQGQVLDTIVYALSIPLCNMLTPLNGPMMGCLAMVGISFPKYIKWAFKYLMMNIGAAIVITMVLQAVGWTGF